MLSFASKLPVNVRLILLAYPYPNDEKELDRLDLQHHMFKLVMGGKLYHVPLENPKQILDIGTGSGIWPLEMGTFGLLHNSISRVRFINSFLLLPRILQHHYSQTLQSQAQTSPQYNQPKFQKIFTS
jgi:hypothetical protein